ncbi:radical SAM protein [Paractinoplanes deccanensis]|uniref:Radical SAM protein n=1 Tax=Paractinoplanes deccanensis TaxID=113561 RepID=A0ABQ3XYI4_9ACTN|nr:4Fe-4S cluster-binding domain-containing protein [Actinoplanes deccanensis]GID72790.1 radical SAM protein [Actinoplanes deccanensis]
MSEPPPVRVARFVERTTAEGPGERTAVWVQGCTIRCPGCFNPHLFTTRGGTPAPPAELAARVLAAGTDGLTLLGGEPFEQAAGLAAVAAAVRDAGRTVMTFTGYDHEDLLHLAGQGRDDVAALLAATDLLAAGPFRRDLLDHDRPWVGSTNQRLVALTDRIEAVPTVRDRLEVTVDASGAVALNGWAGTDALDALLAGLPAKRG